MLAFRRLEAEQRVGHDREERDDDRDDDPAVSAKPKKKLSIGVSARIGTVCSTTAHG